MAVLVEAISVVVRKDAIGRRFEGGWRGFLAGMPNATMCQDEALVRVGFMAPADVEKYVTSLQDAGLTFTDDGKCVDLAVVDQQHGPTMPCSWLQFAQLPIGKGTEDKVSACWLFDGPRMGPGLHIADKNFDLATPKGWEYEGSLSQTFKFVPLRAGDKSLEKLGSKDGLDVYRDRSTGKEKYIGRAFSEGAEVDAGGKSGTAPFAMRENREGVTTLSRLLFARNVPRNLHRLIVVMSVTACVFWTFHYADYIGGYGYDLTAILDFEPSNWLTFFIGLLIAAFVPPVALSIYFALPPIGKTRRGDLVTMLTVFVAELVPVAIEAKQHSWNVSAVFENLAYPVETLTWMFIAPVALTVILKLVVWIWRGLRGSGSQAQQP